jgi:hypothetical protein
LEVLDETPTAESVACTAASLAGCDVSFDCFGGLHGAARERTSAAARSQQPHRNH